MRFVLYNVRYGVGVGSGFHFPLPFGGYLRKSERWMERIIEFLRAQQPDIIGLIEVDSGSFRSGKRNQAEMIAEAMGHYHSHESKYGADSWIGRLPLMNKQANAFVTSNRIHNANFHYFDKGIKRLVIELELEGLTIFLVHLSLKFRHRAHQLGDLHTLVKRVHKPCIVAGDFNALWGKQELQLFKAATGLTNANVSDLPTYPSWAPKRQLDFILHSRQIRVTRLEIPSVTLSDHLPLVCDFEIYP